MRTLQGIKGPTVGFQPGQVSGPGTYVPYQSDQNDWTAMFGMMMPMIMMIMFMAILMPMMKGMAKDASK